MKKTGKSGVFVTGTDTGVGKTLIAAGILARLRANGLDAVPMKPVQTGCVPVGSVLTAPDIEFCLSVAGLEKSGPDSELITPYMFEPACSPHLAAKTAGIKISISRIESCFNKLSKKHEYVVVEGAGGIMVPLSRNVFMLDMMKRLNLPVVLVARPGLGTINHTLLSLNELKRAGLDVKAVFLNHAEKMKKGYIEEDNIKTIRELSGVKALYSMPFVNLSGSWSSIRKKILSAVPYDAQ